MSEEKKEEKKTKKRSVVYYIILAAAVCVFVFSAYKLINIYLEYKQGTDEYDSINEAVNDTPSQTGEDDTETPWVWDFAKMLDINQDTKGWIKQDDILSYPILQTDNNDYYLTRLANKKSNKAGSIFIDYRITDGLEAKNCIIYGHNMKNKSMFGSLTGYYKESYYKEHPSFDVYIGEKHYRYEVIAAYETNEISDAYTYSFGSNESFKAYLDSVRSNSLYQTNFRELTPEDKILTLSTCTDNDDTKRFLVQLVRAEEAASVTSIK